MGRKVSPPEPTARDRSRDRWVTTDRVDWEQTGEASFWRSFGRLRLHVIRGRSESANWIWGAFALQGREQEADWESGYARPEDAMVEAERFAASWHEEETHATLARKAISDSS